MIPDTLADGKALNGIREQAPILKLVRQIEIQITRYTERGTGIWNIFIAAAVAERYTRSMRNG